MAAVLSKPEVQIYHSPGYRYLVEIWLANRFQSSQASDVIKPETGDSMTAILIIDMTS